MSLWSELSSYLPDLIVNPIETAFSVKMLTIYAIGFGLLLVMSIVSNWRDVITKRSLKGILATLVLTLINLFFIPFVMVAVSGLQNLYDAMNIPVVSSEIWASVPFVLLWIISVVSFDFINYWNHRILHMKWLWPIHAIHHSDEDVNGFTTLRVHFLETLVMHITYIIGLSWLGMPPEVAGVGALFFLAHNMYIHSDFGWDHGPLKMLISSPRFHRWHHVEDPDVYGKNLANFIPFFDYIFGTYYNPGPCKTRVGVDGVPHADVVGLLSYPFVEWIRMAKAIFSHQSDQQKYIENPLS